MRGVCSTAAPERESRTATPSMSKLGRALGEGSGDEGSVASGGSRNLFNRRVDWLVEWLSARLPARPCRGEVAMVGEPVGLWRAEKIPDSRRDSRPAMYALERSVAGAVTAGRGMSGRSFAPYIVAISRIWSISCDETVVAVCALAGRRRTETEANELSGVIAMRPK